MIKSSYNMGLAKVAARTHFNKRGETEKSNEC